MTVEYDFDTKFDYFYNKQVENGFKTIWSIYEIDSIDEVASVQGSILVYKDNWGKKVELAVPPNVTWLELWKLADQAIIESGDTHHVYVEAFTKASDGRINLSTGS